jgi:hypothetical protein
MLSPPAPIPSLVGEDGFTLIEMLVAALTGLVLTFASFALLQLATNQSLRARDFVQADQLGRVTMNHIVDELDSACVVAKGPPILETSNKEELLFITAFSKRAEIQPSEVQKHDIYWKKVGTQIGSLYDMTATAEKQTGEHEWTFKAFVKPGVLIDSDIVRATNKATGEREIFKYEGYNEKASEGGEEAANALKPLPMKSGKLTKEEAANVAAVNVSFRSLPSDESEKVGRYDDLSSQVTLAFSAGFTEPKVTSTGACENE